MAELKKYLPYNILLSIAAAACCLIILYNSVLRETFPVLVAYQLPAVGQSVPGESAVERPVADPVILSLVEQAEEEPPADAWWEEWEEAKQLESVQFPLELNAATLEELQFIPGVGNVLSQRIVQYRDHLGGYSHLEQLKEIKGIGDGTYQKISAYLYVA